MTEDLREHKSMNKPRIDLILKVLQLPKEESWLDFFSDQKSEMRDIHIRNQHKILSIVRILEYLILKKKIFGS
jgi:hypothetical protein